jgi:hypothetical protein
MIPNLNVQEIHDTIRAGQARYAMPERDRTDWCAMWRQLVRHVAPAGAPCGASWCAMWRQRGIRLEKLAAELEDTIRQRDMLAKRCAEQARHIAGLLELQAEDAAEAERHPLAEAIAAMQRAGVR